MISLSSISSREIKRLWIELLNNYYDNLRHFDEKMHLDKFASASNPRSANA